MGETVCVDERKESVKVRWFLLHKQSWELCTADTELRGLRDSEDSHSVVTASHPLGFTLYQFKIQ